MKTIRKLSILLIIAVSALAVESCSSDKDDPKPGSFGTWTVKTKDGVKSTHSIVAAAIYKIGVGCNILFTDKKVPFTPEMENPDCHWLRLDIPGKAFETTITDPADLDGSDWDFYYQSDEDNPTDIKFSDSVETVQLKVSESDGATTIKLSMTTTYGVEYTLDFNGAFTSVENYIGPYFLGILDEEWRIASAKGDKTYKVAAAGVGKYSGGYNFVLSDEKQEFTGNMSSIKGNWIYVDIPIEYIGKLICNPSEVDGSSWTFILNDKTFGKIEKIDLKDYTIGSTVQSNRFDLAVNILTKNGDKIGISYSGGATIIDGSRIYP